jgi:hypothetical protein
MHHHKDNMEVQQDNVDTWQLRPSLQVDTSKRPQQEWSELSNLFLLQTKTGLCSSGLSYH